MTSSSVASLLVAALAMLGRPCPRNTAAARLLLQRASGHDDLSPAERETCRDLADALDSRPTSLPERQRECRHFQTNLHVNELE
jgi:hypothetical protein